MLENQILDAEFDISRKTPLNPAFLFITIVGLGGLIGATTNLINGNISEEYFRQIMGWEFNGIWKVAILQGIMFNLHK